MSDLEGDCAIEELVSQYADAPDIDFAIVVLVLDHFWWSVKWGSTLSVPKQWRMNSPSKITYFDSIFYHQYVFRLDIPMNDIIFMHILYCPTNFLYVPSHILLLHGLATQSLVQVVSWTGLQQKINCLCISCVTVKIDDVWMVHIALNFALSDQLCEGLFVQIALFNGFEAVNGISVEMLDEVNFAIAALIDEFQDLEDLLFVVDRQDFELVLSRLLLCKVGNYLLWLFDIVTIFPLHDGLDLFAETPAFVFPLRCLHLFLCESRVLFQPQPFLLVLLLYLRQFASIELFAINKIALFFSCKRGQRASCKILREKQ